MRDSTVAAAIARFAEWSRFPPCCHQPPKRTRPSYQHRIPATKYSATFRSTSMSLQHGPTAYPNSPKTERASGLRGSSQHRCNRAYQQIRRQSQPSQTNARAQVSPMMVHSVKIHRVGNTKYVLSCLQLNSDRMQKTAAVNKKSGEDTREAKQESTSKRLGRL